MICALILPELCQFRVQVFAFFTALKEPGVGLFLGLECVGAQEIDLEFRALISRLTVEDASHALRASSKSSGSSIVPRLFQRDSRRQLRAFRSADRSRPHPRIEDRPYKAQGRKSGLCAALFPTSHRGGLPWTLRSSNHMIFVRRSSSETLDWRLVSSTSNCPSLSNMAP